MTKTAGMKPEPRDKPLNPTEPKEEPKSVSAGPVERIVELALNPSRVTELGFTVLDHNQARLLPQLGIQGLMWDNCVEVAMFRQDADEYFKVHKRKRPIYPNLIDEFTHLTALCQKSYKGENLKSAIELAMAETEAKAGEEDMLGGNKDYWKESE